MNRCWRNYIYGTLSGLKVWGISLMCCILDGDCLQEKLFVYFG